MRVEKKSDFVEISDGLSVNHGGGEVWFIESSLNFDDLPIEFRVQVPKSDKEGFEKLKKTVLSWAERKGYVPVSNKGA